MRLTLSPFARRVAGVFATRVAQFGLAFASSFLIAALLGPEGRGAYVALLLVPGALLAIGQLGLPSALGYFAGRGASIPDLVRHSAISVLALSGTIVIAALLVLPALESSVLAAAPPDLARLILVTVPFGLAASFGGAILFGRQTIRAYNVILLGQSVASLVGIVLLVGISGAGVSGAIATSIVVGAAGTAAILAQVRRLGRDEPAGTPTPLRGLLGYGLRLYPAGVLSYFSYRIDAFLIQALLMSPGRWLGLYSYAVTVAELVFFIPDSISSILFPRIAGATREEADRMVGELSRLTALLAAGAALAVLPAGWLLLGVLLPDFVEAVPALVVLLPGIVALSVSKILTSYVSGRGRPGPVSVAAVIALGVNVAANLVLIPILGIVGAAAASVASYGVHAAMLVLVVARMTGQAPWRLVVPGRAEVVRVIDLVRGLASRPRGPERAASDG